MSHAAKTPQQFFVGPVMSTLSKLRLCLRDEPNREDERTFTSLIRQEVCLHTRMQREHSEEEVMAERPYLNNAYRPLLTIHPDNLTATGTRT